MEEILSEAENDRETHRSLILAFAGFSFTGAFALIVLEPTLRIMVQNPVLFLLVSFLVYLWALNLQSYKSYRWQDQVSTALLDTGSLCLVLALVSLLFSSNFESSFIGLTSGLAVLVWISDYIIRFCIDLKYMQKRDKKKIKG